MNEEEKVELNQDGSINFESETVEEKQTENETTPSEEVTESKEPEKNKDKKKIIIATISTIIVILIIGCSSLFIISKSVKDDTQNSNNVVTTTTESTTITTIASECDIPTGLTDYVDGKDYSDYYSFKEVEKLTNYDKTIDFYGSKSTFSLSNGVLTGEYSSHGCNDSNEYDYIWGDDDNECVRKSFNDSDVKYVQVVQGCIDNDISIFATTSTELKLYSFSDNDGIVETSGDGVYTYGNEKNMSCETSRVIKTGDNYKLIDINLTIPSANADNILYISPYSYYILKDGSLYLNENLQNKKIKYVIWSNYNNAYITEDNYLYYEEYNAETGSYNLTKSSSKVSCYEKSEDETSVTLTFEDETTQTIKIKS